MPIYEYKCAVCEHITSDFRNVDERNHPAICENCGCVAKKIISAPNARTDEMYAGVVDKRLGKEPLTGRKDFEQRCKEKGLVAVTNHEVLNDAD